MEIDEIRQTMKERNEELPGDWIASIGERNGGTYTYWYYNSEYGHDGKKNIDWFELQQMEGEEKQEYLNKWLNGEWPEEYDEYPEAAEIEVYHDAGNDYHVVNLYTLQRYPDGHEKTGDVAKGGTYPEETRECESESEAEEATEQLMEEYSE